MTGMPRSETPDSASSRRSDVLGVVAVAIGLIALLPSLAIFLIGLLPDMQAIFWLLIVTIPILGIGGVTGLLLGAIGIIVGVRRRSRYVWSLIAVVLGALMLVPLGLLYFG
ncbi:hypothetical protein [Microbacterium sp. P01]|uniref:hypothetical protein n=1 Tax=unclassified Microbacterium TaxID=2609290 RepID=UPI00366D7078